MDSQLSLFPLDTDIALAEATVSRDDLTRWNKFGWISDALLTAEKFDTPDIRELTFVRDIARSGLPDAFITQMLSKLPKPYRYESSSVAYSFRHGWVEQALFYEEKELFDVMGDHLADWVEHAASNHSGKLDELESLLADARERMENPEDGEK